MVVPDAPVELYIEMLFILSCLLWAWTLSHQNTESEGKMCFFSKKFWKINKNRKKVNCSLLL